MEDRQDVAHNDLLQRAIDAVMNDPIPDEPLGDTLAELVVAVENAANQPRPLTFKERVFAMKTTTKIAVAASILLSLGGLFAWISSGDGFTSTAFADVGEQVQKARTMTWKRTTTRHGGDSMVAKFAYKEPGLMRQEVRGQLAPGEPGELIFIYDFRQGKMLTLDSRTKSGFFRNLGTLPEKPRRLLMDRGWRLKALFDRDGTPLGEKKIRGRQATGFQVMHDLHVTDIWIDAESGSPLLIDTWDPSGASFVISDLVLDQELDDSLFSLTPPADYRVSKTAREARMPSFGEADLTRGLRFLAEYNGNVFPSQLGLTPEIVMNLKQAQRKETLSRTEAGAIFAGFGRFLIFTEYDDRHYAGKGVKLGTADRPIFWYKPKGSKNYRVIYADLSVKEVSPEELKGFPETSDPE